MFKFWLLLLPVVAMAQLTPNSVTATVWRSASAPPDQIQFGISIGSGTDAGLDEILSVARGAGLTLANLTNLSYAPPYATVPSPPPPDPTGTTTGGTDPAESRLPVIWSFSLGAPMAQMKSTVGLFSALQMNLLQDGKYSLAFFVEGISVSPKAQQAQNCPLPELIADARASASKMASAAGMSTGSILAMSSPTISTSGQASVTSGGTCMLTVKFALAGGI
jgi:hypothetical protein